MANPKVALNTSIRYRSFIQSRNKALEVLLQKRLSQIDAVVSDLKLMVKEIAGFYVQIPQNHSIQRIEDHLDSVFDRAIEITIEAIERLRRSSFTLAYVGELEAIARTLGKQVKGELTSIRVASKKTKQMPSGGSVRGRVTLSYHNLKRRVVKAIQQSMVMSEPLTDAMDRLEYAFPKRKRIKVPRKVLKGPKLKEANPTQKFTDPLITGFVDDTEWQDMVDDYLSRRVPTGRGPEDKVEVPGEDEVKERYTWEVEQEVTQDFVEQVRGGAIDAANDNGITDFVWISVIDDSTDECCLWRDGLTTTEIAAKLSSERSDDECEVQVPPAHFNCRCDISPMSDEMPDTPPPDLGDFEEWLS